MPWPRREKNSIPKKGTFFLSPCRDGYRVLWSRPNPEDEAVEVAESLFGENKTIFFHIGQRFSIREGGNERRSELPEELA
jgi:hypothetical protein